MRARATAAKTYFDLGIISVSHGFSDGFNGLLAPVLALIVLEFGLSEFEAGLLLSLPGLATFLLILPVSLFADLRRNRLELFVAGLALASGAFLSMVHVGAFGVLLALAFLARCGNAVFHPCGTALVAERFPDRRAVAISVFGIAGNIGATGGSVGINLLLPGKSHWSRTLCRWFGRVCSCSGMFSETGAL